MHYNNAYFKWVILHSLLTSNGAAQVNCNVTHSQRELPWKTMQQIFLLNNQTNKRREQWKVKLISRIWPPTSPYGLFNHETFLSGLRTENTLVSRKLVDVFVVLMPFISAKRKKQIKLQLIQFPRKILKVKLHDWLLKKKKKKVEEVAE